MYRKVAIHRATNRIGDGMTDTISRAVREWVNGLTNRDYMDAFMAGPEGFKEVLLSRTGVGTEVVGREERIRAAAPAMLDALRWCISELCIDGTNSPKMAEFRALIAAIEGEK